MLKVVLEHEDGAPACNSGKLEVVELATEGR
jgi:hypothetical protein